MIKTILVPLTGLECDKAALDGAAVIASANDAHVECLRVHPATMQIVARAALRQFLTIQSNKELLYSLQREADTQTRDARATYDKFTKSHERLATSWQQIESDPTHCTIAQAHYADLVVLARPVARGDFSIDTIANILVGCGRPVLLVPATPVQKVGSTVAITWKETAEAARAVSMAMPFLLSAKKIIVIGVSENGSETSDRMESVNRLATQLRRHNLAAEAHWMVAGGRSIRDVLMQTAHEACADLIVMGAYSHSRLRELVFGGVTRHMLQACDLPVLLVH